MSNRAEVAAKRAAYNEFYRSTIAPLVKLSPRERDDLDFAEIAMRLGDPMLRRSYCELALELLDANIEHHSADAQLLELTERDDATPVVSTLVVTAAVNYMWSLSAALIAAAGWYWLAHDTSRRRHVERMRHVREHNHMVAEWEGTISGWKQSEEALHAVLRNIPEMGT